jgi:heptosyltransferase III
MTGERILLVRPGALGDTILSLPLVETVRTRHPGAKLTFLGNHLYRDLLPPDVQFGRFDALERLWLVASGAALHPSEVPEFDLAYLILKNPRDVMANLRRAGTPTIRHASPEPVPGLHMVAKIHRDLGFPVPMASPCLRHFGVAPRENLLWVHPGSGGPSKCLPLEKMVGLVAALRRATGYTVRVTVGEEDQFLRARPEWNALIGTPGTKVLESRPLLEICRTLRSARLFVGNDSGMSHLAAGLGVPAAVFFVSTDPYVWAPWAAPERLHVADVRERGPERIDPTDEAAEILRRL